MASHLVGLDHVEDLSRRRPDDLDIRGLAGPRDGIAHDRAIIDAGAQQDISDSVLLPSQPTRKMSENWLRFVRNSLRVLLLVVCAYFSI